MRERNEAIRSGLVRNRTERSPGLDIRSFDPEGRR